MSRMRASTRSGRDRVRPADTQTRARRSRRRGTGTKRTGSTAAGSTKRKKTRPARTAGRRSTYSTRRPRSAAKRRNKRTAVEHAGGAFLHQNRFSMFLAGLVVLILLVFVSVNAVSLTRKLHENRARARVLEQEIRTEEQRAADIEEYRKYTETDAYIEEIAREKLGLIYEGETVFKEEK